MTAHDPDYLQLCRPKKIFVCAGRPTLGQFGACNNGTGNRRVACRGKVLIRPSFLSAKTC